MSADGRRRKCAEKNLKNKSIGKPCRFRVTLQPAYHCGFCLLFVGYEGGYSSNAEKFTLLITKKLYYSNQQYVGYGESVKITHRQQKLSTKLL